MLCCVLLPINGKENQAETSLLLIEAPCSLALSTEEENRSIALCDMVSFLFLTIPLA